MRSTGTLVLNEGRLRGPGRTPTIPKRALPQAQLERRFAAVVEWYGDGRPTCALDVADAGGITQKQLGDYLGLTRERARQIEVGALKNLALKLVAAGISREDVRDHLHTLMASTPPEAE